MALKKWQRRTALLSAPLLVIVGVMGASISNLCACVHPGVVLVSLERHGQSEMPKGTRRADAEAVLKKYLADDYTTYCPQTPQSDEIRCEFVIQNQYFGLRELGVHMTVRFDSQRVSEVRMSRLDRLIWE